MRQGMIGSPIARGLSKVEGERSKVEGMKESEEGKWRKRGLVFLQVAETVLD